MKKTLLGILVIAALGATLSFADGATYQWVNGQCDLVDPSGDILTTGNDFSLCGGTTYQWVNGQCDLVDPSGDVLTTGNDYSFCG